MAHSAKFLHLVRFNGSPASILSPSRTHFSGKFERLRTLIRSFESAAPITRSSSSNWRLYVRRYITKPSFRSSGNEFNTGRLFGMSVVLGSAGLCPCMVNYMDGYATPVDDHGMGLFNDSDDEKSPHTFFIFAKKLLVPIALALIVWMNWGHPVILAVKVIITLLSTKPSPFSVYLFIDQLQRRYKVQHPLLYKFKSLYAKKVEVEDYAFFCTARVEFGDQRFTLIGILGGWWVFEMTSLQGAFAAFRSRAVTILETAVIALLVEGRAGEHATPLREADEAYGKSTHSIIMPIREIPV